MTISLPQPALRRPRRNPRASAEAPGPVRTTTYPTLRALRTAPLLPAVPPQDLRDPRAGAGVPLEHALQARLGRAREADGARAVARDHRSRQRQLDAGAPDRPRVLGRLPDRALEERRGLG